MKKLNKLILTTILGLSSCFSETIVKDDGKLDIKEKTSENKAKSDDGKLDIQETTIENGLRVIVANMKSRGSVMFGVGYFVGAGDDPLNVVGISHFLEHMMFKGTKNISGPKFKEVMGKYNKNSNAFTDYDITFYTYQCNKTFLDIDLKIEADRMQNLKLDSDDIAKEKEVIIEERKMRMESDPRTKYMVESAYKMMFLYSSYSYPVIGYLDQIKACNKTEIKKHYKKFYAPNNAFALFTGDITLPEAVEKVKKYFGSVKKGDDVKRQRVFDPKDTGLKYTLDHGSDQITVHNLDVMYKIDRDLIDTIKKVVTIEIMQGILAGGDSSILYQNMVDKKELSYTVESFLDIRAFDYGRLSMGTVFRENQKSEKIEEEMDKIINDFADKYLTVDLFEKEKKKIADGFEMMQDNPGSMNMFILGNVCNGYKIDEIKNIKNIAKSIKFEDVKDIAKKILTKENRMLRVYSHPKEK